MMAEDFIEKFHRLEGTLLREKKKSLFMLLESHKSLQFEEHILQEINKKLVPKSYLEEIQKLEFLLYFKRSSELLKVLEGGNDLAASKIIRQSWFIQSVLKDLKNEEFVRDVFPQLSVVVRMKLLKQIIKEFRNEDYIDSLFESVLTTYGLQLAVVLLSGCSISKIKEILLNLCLKLSKYQLKLLHDKNSSLISFYYGEYFKKGGEMNDLRDFSKYLSGRDPNLYVKLLFKYKFDPHKLGWQTTNQYVSEHKKEIMEDPQKYLNLNIFQKHALVKQLDDDFPLFLKSSLPKKLSDLMGSQAFGLLNYYPKKKRYELYSKLFEEVYKKSLFPRKEFITKELLEVIPSDIEREKWVEKFENQVEYIQFKRSSSAVQELRERLIRSNDVRFQEQLLEHIVTSCSISEDYDSLLDILKLFCCRFKKSDGSVLFNFLSWIHGKIKLDELTGEHWKYINEIILIQNKRNLSINGFITVEYSKFLYKNGKEFEEMIPIYLKSDVYYFPLRKIKFKDQKFKDDRFQREFLKLILKYSCFQMPDLDGMKEVVLAIRDWNKRHPGNVILVSEKKKIIEAIKKSADLHWIYHPGDEFSCMKYLICCENMYESFTEIYFNPINCLENVAMIKWHLKYQPNVFQERIDRIVECLHVNSRYMMKFIRKYEHTGLVQMIVKYYLKKLKDPEEKTKDKIAQLLASVMPNKDYMVLLKEHVPRIDEFDIKKASIEEANLHIIQIALAKSVRFATCQLDVFPILLNYCRGAYLNASLFSIYYCFNKIPEKSLVTVLEFLVQKPISVRKHAMFLAGLVFPRKTNEELFQRIIDDDINTSIQKHLCSHSYRYFLNNPLQQFWNIFQISTSHLSLNEKETLTLLANVCNVPEKYKNLFLQLICEVFDNLEKKGETSMDGYYNKLMDSVKDYDMTLISSDLCVDIISKKLFEENYKKNEACVNFTIRFLMYGVNIRQNIQYFLKVLELYKQKHWNTSSGHLARSVIHSICKNIFDKTMDRTAHRVFLAKEFALLLSEEWKKVFTFKETFEEYLMLDFMILQYEDNNSSTFHAGEINKTYKHLWVSYGDIIIRFFRDFLALSLRFMLGDYNYDLQLIKLLADMLEKDPTLPNCLLVIQLLPQYQFDDEFINKFNYILEKLQAEAETLQVHLSAYFKKEIYC